MSGPDALLTAPGITCTWLLLHGADWFLTVAGARARLRVAEHFPLATGYELNPLFQKDIARGGWISRRFLVTWFGGAAVFWLAFAVFGAVDVTGLAGTPWLADVPAFLAGMLVFTRAVVIGRHLHNLWLFRRVARHPDAMRGAASFDARTTYGVSASYILQFGVVLGVAACLAPSPWLVGGALGCLLLAGKHGLLGLRARKPAA